jgi:hypothetical protein
VPSTDVVFALAVRIVGEELCTLPTANFINFVHMKPATNGFSEGMNFDEVFVTEFDHGMIRINNVNQYHPLHYYNKNLEVGKLTEFYEQHHMG